MEIDTYHKKTYAPLEPHELKKLKKGAYILPFVIAFMGTVMYFLFRDMQYGDFFFWVGVFFITAFVGILGYASWALYMDITKGEKEIFQGVITRKDKVRFRRKKGGSKTSYYLYFGKHYERVELHLYNQFEEGDMIEIHRAKRTYNVIFDTKVIKKGVMMDKITEMREERELKAKKNAWKPIVGFLLGIPVFLSVMFLIIADCFNCGPKYSASLAAWNNVTQQEVAGFSAEGQQICMLMNDTLKDVEEGQIVEIFNQAKVEGRISDLIITLDAEYPPSNSERSVLKWMKYKFGEEHSRRYPLTFVGIWASTIHTFTGIDLLKRKKLSKSEFNIGDLNVNPRTSLSYNALIAWHNHTSDEERQRYATYALEKDTSEFSTDYNRYMKDIWSKPIALPFKDKAKYEQGRAKYGLE